MAISYPNVNRLSIRKMSKAKIYEKRQILLPIMTFSRDEPVNLAILGRLY